jgi:hypothetical protein
VRLERTIGKSMLTVSQDKPTWDGWTRGGRVLSQIRPRARARPTLMLYGRPGDSHVSRADRAAGASQGERW